MTRDSTLRIADRHGHLAYVAFGSNLGRRRATIERALAALATVDGIELRRVSALYETEPVGGPRQPSFLNGVAELLVTDGPARLLSALLQIERKLGRRRKTKWGPRSIDLDLITFDSRLVNETRLKLPHPRYHERRFVLMPLCDLAPNALHPRLNVTNRTLLKRLPVASQRVTMIATWKKSRFRPFAKRS